MLFIETPIFTKRLNLLMRDDDYRELQQALADNPFLGTVLKNSGGIRKVRWGSLHQGKSGAYRILYHYAEQANHVRMLFIFSKNEMSNLSDEQLSSLRKILERW
jgi:hypothetical protein